MNKRVTLRDVAKAANLSLTSFSLVLSGRTNQISAASCTHILAAVERLGYQGPTRSRQPSARGKLQGARHKFLTINAVMEYNKRYCQV